MKTTADVIVIGSGIIGNATAYYLAKNGLDVIVLEKDAAIGNGSSSRNGGGVRQSGRDVRELPLAMYAVKNLWPNLADELGMSVEYHQDGNLRLGKTDAHLVKLKQLADNASAVGLDVKMIRAEEIKKICPYMSDEVIGASWCPTDGHANPLLATLAYYRKARQSGVQFYSGVTVEKLGLVRGKVRKVITSDGTFETEMVVVAAGIGSRPILNSVGIDIPMNPKIADTIVTEAQAPMFWQMLGTAAADFYGHQTEHGSFVFGGGSGHETYAKHPEQMYSTSITASYICRAIGGYFPALNDTKIVRTWAGCHDICSDGVPVIDRIDEIEGLVAGCGFSGHGFGIAPSAALVLSELAMGKKASIDISGLRYNRFVAKA